MALYLGLLIFSFIITGIAMIPFIDLLYRLHLTYHRPIKPLAPQESKEFNTIQSHQTWKIGTPIGGGLLIIFTTAFLYVFLFPILVRSGVYVTTVFPFKEELNIIFFTFISFGLLGLYEDIIKIFNLPRPFYASHLWPRRKTFFIFLLSILVALTLYLNLGIHIIHVPYLGVIELGWTYIPLASIIITGFSKAFDVTDGMDGLASGVLLICLLAFWGISLASLDTVLSVFIAFWVGGLLAFLYFNVYPARIWLGNGGSLSFGATLAVVGLVLSKTFALLIIGLVFVVEAASQVIQIVSLKVFSKKAFPVTPLHYWLQSLGWPEPKVVFRLWLLAILSAVVGLWSATF
jgi:phospho-N-acetylmuramoyl-pentapeptide-transferase